MQNQVVKYRAERSGFVYYSLGVVVMLFAFWLIGHGAVVRFGHELNETYFASPTCDDKLLLDGQDHYAMPCAVIDARVIDHDLKDDRVLFGIRVPPELKAASRKFPDAFASIMPDWPEGKYQDLVRLQIYDNGTDYLVAKVYDKAAKTVRLPKDHPASKKESAWSSIKLGLIILGCCILWIFAGRFMKFSE